MTEPNGHVCPECAAPRTPDGTPSCGCTERASDALREARTAEAAAAEDFDPLRIRPYVELAELGTKDASDATMRLDTVPSDATMRLDTVPSDATMRLDTVPSAAAARHGRPEEPIPYPPLAPPSGAVPDALPDALPDDRSEEPPRRRRRTAALLAVAGAAVAVVAAAGFASGLFSYDAPARDEALPDEIRASVPESSSTSTSPAPSSSERGSSPAGSAPAAGGDPGSQPSARPTSSASPSTTSARPSPSVTPSPTPPSATTTTTGSLAPGQDASDTQPVQTLQRGDKGPEVTELQLRLAQLSLYTGDTDGVYSRQVEDAVRRYQKARGITGDEQGVYGAATRASLEKETTEP